MEAIKNEFISNVKDFLKDNNTNVNGLLYIYDNDSNNTLSYAEFENMILSFNSQFQEIKKNIQYLFSTLISNQKNEVDLKALDNLLTEQPIKKEESKDQEKLVQYPIQLDSQQYKYASFLSEPVEKQLAYVDEYFKIAETASNNYIDQDFPINQASIGNYKIKKNYEWRSLQQEYGQGYDLFPKDQGYITFDQLPRQGKLGNCYLISPISAVYYNHPEHIKSLFIDQTEGITSLKLNIDGQWCVLWMDNYFPFNKTKNIPAFTKRLGQSVWAMYIEKAWAKAFRCYKSTNSGFNKTGLRALTGAPVASVNPNVADFAKKLEYWAFMKYPMTASSKGRGRLDKLDQEDYDNESNPISSKGLSGNHAYSILQVIDGTSKNGQITKFLAVRNPWGFKKWKGDQKQELFEKEMSQELNMSLKQNNNQDSGVFYIEVSNFAKYFSSLDVCFFEPASLYESIRIYSTRQQVAMYQIQVKKEGQYCFTITQKNPRFFRANKEITYSVCPSYVGVINEEFKIIRHCKEKSTRYNSVQSMLKCCKLYQYNIIKKLIISSPSFEFVLSSYGQDMVNFQFLGFDTISLSELKVNIDKLPNLVEQYHQQKTESLNKLKLQDFADSNKLYTLDKPFLSTQTDKNNCQIY